MARIRLVLHRLLESMYLDALEQPFYHSVEFYCNSHLSRGVGSADGATHGRQRNRSLMRSFRRRVTGRESHKFSFAFHAHSMTGFASPAQGLPDGSTAMLQITRGAKIVATAPAAVVRGEVTWEQQLEFVCTLYASKKERRPFSEKNFRIALAVVIPDKSKRPHEVAAADIDVRKPDSNPRPFALLELEFLCPSSLQSAEGRTFESHSGRWSPVRTSSKRSPCWT